MVHYMFALLTLAALPASIPAVEIGFLESDGGGTFPNSRKEEITYPWNVQALSTSGNFFYAQLNTATGAPQFMTVGVGSSGQKMNVLLHSKFNNLALFSTAATESQSSSVPSPYNQTAGGETTSTNTKESTETITLYDQAKSSFQSYDLKSEQTSAMVNFTMAEYLREFNFNTSAQFVQQVTNQPFTSAAISGFLGFAPNTQEQNSSLLHQLQANGNIYNEVIAFFVDGRSAATSMVKFGSFDQRGFRVFSTMLLLNTTNNNEWAVQSKEFQIKVNDLGTGTHTPVVFFEPAQPYIYIPQDQYQILKTQIGEHFQSKNMKIDQNEIYFESTCAEVNETTPMNMSIAFDGLGSQSIYFTLADLLVDSEQYNNSTGKCYIGVFPGAVPDHQDFVVFGQLYLNKYYTFFDAQMLKNGTSQSLNIGTGLRTRYSSSNQILQNQYNRSDLFYNPDRGDQSQWTYQPNDYTRWRFWGIGGENVNLYLIIFLVVLLGGLCLGVSIFIGIKARKWWLEKERERVIARNPGSPDSNIKMSKYIMKMKTYQLQGLEDHEINERLRNEYEDNAEDRGFHSSDEDPY